KMETKTISRITKDLTIGELVERYPEIVDTLMGFGVHCVGCHVSPYETLEQGLMGHGMTEQDVELAISTLNNVLDTKLKEAEVEDKIESQGVTITEKGVEKVKELMKKENKTDDHGLRIEVLPGGCAGMSYDMSFDNKEREGDKLFIQDGLKIFVDKDSLKFLNGLRVDYVDSLQGSGFKIDNPNATKSCGC
ncbi:MAG: iron-sulfur cluster assembly accessory protein, partial [Nanoarchaeota archaeon]